MQPFVLRRASPDVYWAAIRGIRDPLTSSLLISSTNKLNGKQCGFPLQLFSSLSTVEFFNNAEVH
jgi:hypothetical protein